MPAIYAALAQDASRNDLIFDDVLKSLEAKRSPIVLTERKDHLDYLQQRFSPLVKNLVVLRGGMSAGERKMENTALHVSDDQERLILAIGRWPLRLSPTDAHRLALPPSRAIVDAWLDAMPAATSSAEIGMNFPAPAGNTRISKIVSKVSAPTHRMRRSIMVSLLDWWGRRPPLSQTTDYDQRMQQLSRLHSHQCPALGPW
jgi:hypothetical protein